MRYLPLILSALAGAALVDGAAPPARVLIVTGQTDLPYHDWRVTTPWLREALARTGRFEIRVMEEPRGLDSRILAGYDVLLLHYNGPRWGGQAERAVEDFLRAGKGMVAFHGVSYGPFYGLENRGGKWTPTAEPAWGAYAGMMGCTWKPGNIGHAARHVFPVKWVDREHPISRGLPETFIANDELYHKMDLAPNAHVLATAYDNPAERGTGRDEPIVWTVPVGRGRVVHITLGHDLSAMYQTGFLTVLARALEWSATGAVTLPARVSAQPVPAKDAVRALVVTGGHSYPPSFYTLFEGYPDLRWTHAATQPQAFNARLLQRYDVLVLHDCSETIGEAERAHLRAFADAGKGVVSIHHSIVDYTSWPWWHEQVIGGKYFTKPVDGHARSEYKEDIEIVARAVKGVNHPVLRGVPPLALEDDEAYRGMWHAPGITVLMETDNPLNDRPMVYLGPHPKARAIYIQPGHSDATMRHPGYRKLVHNAILWAAGRLR